MSRSKDKASVVNHGDHEVIVPDNKLNIAVTNKAPDDNSEDPITRAEKALAALSPEFGAWMDSECERLDGARRDILRDGFTDATKEALFALRMTSRAKRQPSAIRQWRWRPRAFAGSSSTRRIRTEFPQR